MSALAAAVLAAGELICEFDTKAVLLYEVRSTAQAAVLDSRRPGRRAVALREEHGQLHLIEDDGPSVRVTTLTECTRTKGFQCTRYAAQHAWHFDTRAHQEPWASLHRRPSGAASGACEPWRVD